MVDSTAAPLCDKASADAAAQLASGQLAGAVAAMVKSVKAAAPNAKVVLTGYPYLYNPGTLDPADPMSVFIDKATLLADGLNGSIAGAAAATGATYVDVRTAFATTASTRQIPGSIWTSPTWAAPTTSTQTRKATRRTTQR
ncbi:hypothetical protein ACOM2C_09385 [Pseudarthrobacter sp. So.54]